MAETQKEAALEQKVARETSRLGGKEAVSLWAIKELQMKTAASRVWHGVLDDDVFGRSAQLAYYFFFAIFPTLVFISSVLGLMGRAGSSVIENLLVNLSRLLPPSAFQIIVTTFHQTARASGAGKLAFGIITALWSATAGMTAIQDTLNAVYKARETRPLWKMYLSAIALTLLGALLASMALAVLFYGAAVSKFLHLDLALSILLKLLVWPIAFSLLALLFACTYYWAPDVKDTRWQWITPGALVGIIGWILASVGLRVYLHFFNTYSATYGSLGAVIILLTWFYISGLMLLLGAEVNSVIEGLLTPVRRKVAEQQDLSRAS